MTFFAIKFYSKENTTEIKYYLASKNSYQIPQKYIIYKCSYLCGGWGDRLKGKFDK
jgi:hypothetical protein